MICDYFDRIVDVEIAIKKMIEDNFIEPKDASMVCQSLAYHYANHVVGNHQVKTAIKPEDMSGT